jgi:hypothetical protein
MEARPALREDWSGPSIEEEAKKGMPVLFVIGVSVFAKVVNSLENLEITWHFFDVGGSLAVPVPADYQSKMPLAAMQVLCGREWHRPRLN